MIEIMLGGSLFVSILAVWFATWRWGVWKRRYDNLRGIKIGEITNSLTGIVLGVHNVTPDAWQQMQQFVNGQEWPEQIEDK